MTLARTVLGIPFSNPVLLSAGTAGFGKELHNVVNLRALGGLVTKAVSPLPRHGNPSPRVAELRAGMLNSVGLANPGLASVRADYLPWLAATLPGWPVIVNVVGFAIEDYPTVIRGLDALPHHAGYELNLSCPNTDAGGIEFGAREDSVAEVVERCRRETARPIFVKLAPNLPDLPTMARAAKEAGASGVTLVNTLPGVAFEHGIPTVGRGFGGVSGPALFPVMLLAVQRVARAIPDFPIIAAGGIASASDVRQALDAGATLVAIGTAALASPRLPERIVEALERRGG